MAGRSVVDDLDLAGVKIELDAQLRAIEDTLNRGKRLLPLAIEGFAAQGIAGADLEQRKARQQAPRPIRSGNLENRRGMDGRLVRLVLLVAVVPEWPVEPWQQLGRRG